MREYMGAAGEWSVGGGGLDDGGMVMRAWGWTGGRGGDGDDGSGFELATCSLSRVWQ